MELDINLSDKKSIKSAIKSLKSMQANKDFDNAVVNKLVDEWLDTMNLDQEKIPHFKELKEMLGHTPIEVIGGIIVGIVVSSIV